MSSKLRGTRPRTGPSVRSGPGPLRNLIDRISLLESKVVSLESELRLAKRKLANSNGSGGTSESLINELLTSKLSKQQFAMTLVPITDDIRITSISGCGAATPAPLLVPVPCSSPFQTQAQTVLIKTDPDALEILGDESNANSGFADCDFDQDMDDIDIEWGLQNTDCDSKARDPDWKADSNTSKSNPDTTKKRKRPETEEKQDLSGYQIEVVTSNHGKPMLAINGFTFRKKKQRGEIGYWACTKSTGQIKCKARCKTIGPNDEVVSVSPDETHGHSSNSTEIEKRKIIAKLKSDANTSTETTAKFVDSTIAELSQGVNNDVARLLDKKYLCWSINKIRKMSQPSTSNSDSQNQSDSGSGPSGQDESQEAGQGHTVGIGT